jgi:Glycoside-hydrolase family GH114
MRYAVVALLTLGVAFAAVRPGAAQEPPYWVPNASDTFQWDLEEPVPLDVNATVYDIDMFDNKAGLVARLHALGRHVICYIDAGSWESYRPDANRYPKSILGRRYPGYPQERFVDIRALPLLGPILAARFDLCKAKGFDAVEPDNMDTYQARTGFPLTYQDEITFSTWLVTQAHRRGLSIGQKNDPAQVKALVGEFDWALLEECFYYTFCGKFAPYVQSGKVVFDTEYRSDESKKTFLDVDCPGDARFGFFLIYKKLNLDAYRVTCSASVDDPNGLPWQLGRPGRSAPTGGGFEDPRSGYAQVHAANTDFTRPRP